MNIVSQIFSYVSFLAFPAYLFYLNSQHSCIEQTTTQIINSGEKNLLKKGGRAVAWRAAFLFENLRPGMMNPEIYYALQINVRNKLLPKWVTIHTTRANTPSEAIEKFENTGFADIFKHPRKADKVIDYLGKKELWRYAKLAMLATAFSVEIFRLILLA